MPFTGSGVDVREDDRDPDSLRAFADNQSARAIVFHKGQPALTPDMALQTFKLDALIGTNLFDPGPMFLGTDEQGPLFAFNVEDPTSVATEEAFQPLRMVGGRLPAKDLAIAGRARSLFDWHHNHLFCAKCGTPSAPAESGMKRVCPSCKAEHFPRVNPVAIMLIIYEDACLLGRGHGWPDGYYSALAGFVSPGESLEEACIREVKEEVDVDVRNVEYVFSQPWPFPSQLMMGLICYADNRKFTVNPKEIEAAKWVSKDEVRAVFNKTGDAFMRPPRVTIAHQLLKHWIAE